MAIAESKPNIEAGETEKEDVLNKGMWRSEKYVNGNRIIKESHFQWRSTNWYKACAVLNDVFAISCGIRNES